MTEMSLSKITGDCKVRGCDLEGDSEDRITEWPRITDGIIE